MMMRSYFVTLVKYQNRNVYIPICRYSIPLNEKKKDKFYWSKFSAGLLMSGFIVYIFTKYAILKVKYLKSL